MEQIIHMTFSHVGSGIEARDGKLSYYEVLDQQDHVYQVIPEIAAGENEVLDTLIIDVKEINSPKSVRYAWDNAPGVIDFNNAEGLPALPFYCELVQNGL